MNRTLYMQVLLIFILMLTSCTTKEKSENFVKEKLEYDSSVINDSTRSIISRIDGSRIDDSILEEKITSLMNSADVTGLAITILNDNQIVFRKGFGYANQKKKTSLQINHSFYGASFSKAVFGYLVSILVT